MTANRRTGGQILVDCLRLHGADTVFCVPGESYLATLDALYDARDDVRLIVCRQEGGAAYMAEAYGKLEGRPGLCFVTRGPGAANASVGIHTASQDSTPVILFVGQVDRAMVGREAFQEIDVRTMFAGQAKWATQIDDPERIPELVSRAFHVAVSGRPGPVVLALPEDVQTERAAVEDGAPYREIQPHPGAPDIEAMRGLLAAAKRPLLLLGGSGWTATACADIRRFAEAAGLPAAVAFRRQDLFDNRHPNYAGVIGLGADAALIERVRGADLLLVVGAQLGEVVTQGYTLFDLPRPRQRLIHVAPGIADLGKVYQADLAINAGMPQFAAAAALAAAGGGAHVGEAAAGRAAYEAFSTAAPTGADLDYGAVVAWLDRILPEDAILANGAGNYSVWLHRYFRYRRFGTQLAPQSGSMGYGVPAGVAAGLVRPGRTVVSFSGDGCFLMNGQELATAARYRLDVVFIVVDNAKYGTIRAHQERHYPARVHGTDLVNPDFAAYARAFGCHGETVERTADFAPAFDRARAADGPAVIELRVDPDALSPTATVDSLRAAARMA